MIITHPDSPPDTASWLAKRDGVAQLWARYTDLVIERASGSWVETIDGERYLDFTSGIAVANTGHAHPRVSAAIAEQAALGVHLQQNIVYHKPGLELHARLPRSFPGATNGAVAGEPVGLFLSNSGAEAIEASVKLAKIATRRPLIVAFRGGFHGRTHGAMALTSSGVRIRGHFEPLPGGVHFVPFPDPLRVGGGSAEAAIDVTMTAIEDLFATLAYPDDVAAFIVEPILGEGGYVVPSDTFLPRLREVADKHGILLIADEIQTGYGRTGRFFGIEWSNVVADIVVMAKGIASGLPLSGIMARRSLLNAFSAGTHGGTYGGNVVACAAALATLDVFEDEGLVDASRRQGERLIEGVRRVAAGIPAVADVRGRGMMVAIEFADPGTLAPRPELAKKLLSAALDRHLMLLSCGTWGQAVRIIPPLTASDAEVDQAIATIGESLATLS